MVTVPVGLLPEVGWVVSGVDDVHAVSIRERTATPASAVLFISLLLVRSAIVRSMLIP
jgi:hypothetical protein